MVNRNDINLLFGSLLWIALIILAALDGLSLFVAVYFGVGMIVYWETVKVWECCGLSWEFIVLFIGTVVAWTTAVVYMLAVLGYIARMDVELMYLQKLIPGYGGIFVYVAYQSKLLRRQQREIHDGIRQIKNGNKS